MILPYDIRLIIVQPSAEIIYPQSPSGADEILNTIETAGRTCYKSEARIKAGSAEKFVRGIVKSGHLSVVEHGHVTARVICSRACSHQIVRHRIAAFSQESQRYCDYAGDKGEEGLRVICPPSVVPLTDTPMRVRPTTYTWDEWEVRVPSRGWTPFVELFSPDNCHRLQMWLEAVCFSYQSYLGMRSEWTDPLPPEDARFALPNATKTEIVWTQNLRQWRHVMEERALNTHAQWEIRRVTLQIGAELSALFPAVFGDIAAALEEARRDLEASA